eukprot:TRINITY_DN3509_c0_g1_i2.p1 TRINITY_DN3509_c0_g1~~TRINITY_DN3509_c0_g1_i2.p1  ORF type:complete len:174 (-),score=21.52 TRINITY_DN3509_c0_g1_i2:108-629(-)
MRTVQNRPFQDSKCVSINSLISNSGATVQKIVTKWLRVSGRLKQVYINDIDFEWNSDKSPHKEMALISIYCFIFENMKPLCEKLNTVHTVTLQCPLHDLFGTLIKYVEHKKGEVVWVNRVGEQVSQKDWNNSLRDSAPDATPPRTTPKLKRSFSQRTKNRIMKKKKKRSGNNQ